ncbi:MAG TPA: hypothetical protein VGB85_24730 [Nannocystis sp.]
MVDVDSPVEGSLVWLAIVVPVSPIDASVSDALSVGSIPVGASVVAVPVLAVVELDTSSEPSASIGSQPSPRLSHQLIIEIIAIQATLFMARPS